MAAASASSSVPSYSIRRTNTGSLNIRPVCKYGAKCRRQNPTHFEEEAHPADEDYIFGCREHKVKPEFVSVYMLFKWCDCEQNGRASREELAKVWDQIQAYGQNIGQLTDELWKTLDDDGNGYINFNEFAEFTKRYEFTLPLGLDSLLGDKGSTHETLRCGVQGCPCVEFAERRRRCQYGDGCYQKSEKHRGAFCHPCDEDWAHDLKYRDQNMCRCGHKKKLHATPMTMAGAVQYPRYWKNVAKGDEDFNELVPIGSDMLVMLQRLVDSTYDDITTRDRLRHHGSWLVPESFEVTAAERNENSKLWRKYLVKKAELQRDKKMMEEHQDEENLPYELYEDVKTSLAWRDIGAEANGAEPLDEQVNEWYLWHGTTGSASRSICSTDFKMQVAGTQTGSLYGKGTYLGESITKADEYSKCEGGTYTVLLCRVLGGRVRFTAEREPDPEQLMKDCMQGCHDCVLGDRRKVSGTYREFVIFDTENVYPEYLLTYKRGPLFKSRSCPG